MSSASKAPQSVAKAAATRHRVATPARLQMETTECGAASLGIVLAHFGRWVPLEDLRDACGISRDGSNAKDVKDAAIAYGLDVRATKREPDDLKQMTLPLVVFWRFNHFLVVEGWSRNGWYLNDPATGHRVCSPEEFDESFTGVVLQMTPGPEFRPGGKAPGTLTRLTRALRGSRDGVALMALIGLILIVPQILVPGLARIFVDSLVGAAALDARTIIIALVFAAILQAGLIGLQSTVGLRLATKISVVLSARLVARLLLLPAQFHALRGASTLAYRVEQSKRVATTVASLLSTVAVAIISSTTAMVVLLVAYVPAGLVATVALILVIVSQRVIATRQRTLALRMVSVQSEVAGITSTALAQVEVIKASGAEDALVERWTRAHDRLLAASQELGERMGVVTLLPGTITSLANAGVAIVALFGVVNGSLSLGGLVAVQTLSGLVLSPVATAVSQIQAAQALGGELDQIDDVINTPPDLQFQVTERTAGPDHVPAPIVGDLRLAGVTFGYGQGGPPLIRDLDLHVPPGARVALVGPSGCGKSTVCRLVAGWYQPWSGDLLVDGRPRSWWPDTSLTGSIGIVEQDPTVFSGTIRDNLTMWNPTIPETDMIQAAIDACLHDDIARRPGAYEAELTENGADLSGGQRQRLEIARALARNPVLIVLDEATSALDAATEAQVDAAIRRRGASALIIAHRLSTIRDCDEIIVLDAGAVVERGTHDQLFALNGAYAELVSA